MSFVGPRPQVQVDFDSYTAEQKAAVIAVRPGITGIGSVVFRDEERYLSAPGVEPRAFYRDEIAPYKGALEQWYLRHSSFRIDLLLLWATVVAVARPDSQLVFRVLPDLPTAPAWLAV
jgi:lipopolysaccharide/colanic/teichoic acid biosynthesis glycosyltransferase